MGNRIVQMIKLLAALVCDMDLRTKDSIVLVLWKLSFPLGLRVTMSHAKHFLAAAPRRSVKAWSSSTCFWIFWPSCLKTPCRATIRLIPRFDLGPRFSPALVVTRKP